MYSVGIAYLLWLISGCGALGLHRFYLGKIPSGLLWMMTGGLGMFGSIYDFFTLPSQVREANIRNAIYSGGASERINSQQSYRTVNDGASRIVREKENVERVILRIAKENKGIITASEIALAANIPIEQAKNDLEMLVSKGFAELRVRKSGTLVYAIPDLVDRDEPLEDI
ncbi:MAG: TM2 domain-containing protein [Treponema sp.]|jgi:TM2 domain-containing membrane protein YozV/predicted transcriptional regulator|nr:TM2 domain-containing protein [Treponema sp.]